MSEFFILARTLYGECRGETLAGKMAVAHVIKNRAAKGGWWGDDISSVCLHPKQFSCWDDHNRLGMMTVQEALPSFRECMFVAISVLYGHNADPTNGSCHYCTLDTDPPWAKGKASVISIGNHKFFDNID